MSIDQLTLEVWKECLKTQYQLHGDYSISPRHSPDAPTIEQMAAIRAAHLSIQKLVEQCLETNVILLDPDMPTQQLRLHMGELTASEVRVARAAIRWANSRSGL